MLLRRKAPSLYFSTRVNRTERNAKDGPARSSDRVPLIFFPPFMSSVELDLFGSNATSVKFPFPVIYTPLSQPEPNSTTDTPMGDNDNDGQPAGKTTVDWANEKEDEISQKGRKDTKKELKIHPCEQ